jgi:hypothetical protein
MTWAQDTIYIPAAVMGFTAGSILDYLVIEGFITYEKSLVIEEKFCSN